MHKKLNYYGELYLAIRNEHFREKGMGKLTRGCSEGERRGAIVPRKVGRAL